VEDMRVERDAVTEVLTQLKQFISRSEYIVAKPDSPKEVCLAEAGNCDVFIGIYKSRYGEIPAEENPDFHSVPEMEYHAARKKGKPIFIFVSSETKERETRLQEFLDKIQNYSSGHFRKTFYNIDQLKHHVYQAVDQYLHEHPVLNQLESNNFRTFVEEQQIAYYKKVLRRTLEYLDFRGIAQVRRIIQVKLKSIYVQQKIMHKIMREDPTGGDIPHDTKLDAVEFSSQTIPQIALPVSMLCTFIKEKRNSLQPSNQKQNKTFEIDNLRAAIQNHDLIAILGIPATGKTTLLKYTALSTIEQDQTSLLPIFVSIREYGTEISRISNLNLHSFIDNHLVDKFNLTQGFVLRQLSEGRCLVLLDGLDEVMDLATRKKVASRIDDFVAQFGGMNKIVVTSRIVGYTDAMLSGGFEHYTILPFGKEQMSDYIDKWAEMVEKSEKVNDYDMEGASHQASALRSIIFEDINIFELAKSPLILNILCLLNRQGITIPTRRVELYEQAIDTLIKTWDLSKGIELKMDPLIMKDLLQRLAFWFYVKNRITSSEYDIQNYLRDQMSRLGLSELNFDKMVTQFLESATERSGIIVEVGLKEYSFVHSALKDHLAARELAGQSTVKDTFDTHFRRSLHADRNSEIIPLVAAHLRLQNIDKSSEFVGYVLDAKTQFEKILPLDLMLAIRCIAEGGIVSGTIKRRIVSSIKQICSQDRRVQIKQLMSRLLDSYYRDDIASILEELVDSKPGLVLNILQSVDSDISAFEVLVRMAYNKIMSNNMSDSSSDVAVFLNSRLLKEERLVIDLAKDYLHLDRSKLYMLVFPLSKLGTYRVDIKEFLIDLAITHIKLLALVYIYDNQLFKEMQKKLGSGSPNMKHFSELIETLSSTTDVKLIDEYIGELEDKNPVEEFNIPFVLLWLNVQEIKKIIMIAMAFSETDREYSCEITRELINAGRDKASANKLLEALKDFEPTIHQDKKLRAVMLAKLAGTNSNTNQILKEIVFDKTQPSFLRRMALSSIESLIVESPELHMQLLDDPALLANVAHQMILRRVSIDLVAEKIMNHDDYSWMLEDIVKATYEQRMN
jgi:hypothetical protein